MTDERPTLFAFVDGPPEPTPLRVPPIIVEQIEARLAERLDELASLVSTSCKEALADKVRVLSARQWASTKSAPLAVRRARISRLIEIFDAVGDAEDLLMASQSDDPGFLPPPAAEAVVAALQPADDARDALLAVQAELPPPGKADHRRTSPPVKYFLVSAAILWWEETRTLPRKHGSAYQQWLTVLWEVATGEPRRTFSKALRKV